MPFNSIKFVFYFIAFYQKFGKEITRSVIYIELYCKVINVKID